MGKGDTYRPLTGNKGQGGRKKKILPWTYSLAGKNFRVWVEGGGTKERASGKRKKNNNWVERGKRERERQREGNENIGDQQGRSKKRQHARLYEKSKQMGRGTFTKKKRWVHREHRRTSP